MDKVRNKLNIPLLASIMQDANQSWVDISCSTTRLTECTTKCNIFLFLRTCYVIITLSQRNSPLYWSPILLVTCDEPVYEAFCHAKHSQLTLCTESSNNYDSHHMSAKPFRLILYLFFFFFLSQLGSSKNSCWSVGVLVWPAGFLRTELLKSWQHRLCVCVLLYECARVGGRMTPFCFNLIVFCWNIMVEAVHSATITSVHSSVAVKLKSALCSPTLVMHANVLDSTSSGVCVHVCEWVQMWPIYTE